MPFTIREVAAKLPLIVHDAYDLLSYTEKWQLYIVHNNMEIYTNIHALLAVFRRISDDICATTILAEYSILMIWIHCITTYHDAADASCTPITKEFAIQVPYYGSIPTIELNVIVPLYNYYRTDYTCDGAIVVTDKSAWLMCDSYDAITHKRELCAKFIVAFYGDLDDCDGPSHYNLFKFISDNSGGIEGLRPAIPLGGDFTPP
jgi:hypothetical protein